MPSIRSLVLLACLGAAVTLTAQQPLSCPAPADPSRPCTRFHFHEQMYRPDTKQFFELTAGEAFATMASCERAREIRVTANAKVVSFHRSVKDQKYPEDRIGPCHCDMTAEKSSIAFVAPPQRIAQKRMAAEVRLRVRERLIAKGLPTDAEVIRLLLSDTPATPLLSGPRHVPMPAASVSAPTFSSDELRNTRAPESARSSVAALELPLADVAGAVVVPPAEPPAPATPVKETMVAAEPPVETSVEAPAETVNNGDEIEIVATTAEEPEAPASPASEAVPEASAQEIAEQFVTYETQRIQLVLGAAGAIGNESVKSQIFQAFQQRIRLLTNLRVLIEGSGSRSALATAARAATTEQQRLALIARLFGEELTPHWAPRDAADVIVPTGNVPSVAPEDILRDSAGRFTASQKKRALYDLLAGTQPTEEQRLWLSSIVESFLR